MKRVLAALILIACGDDEPTYTVCDGSDAVRFGTATVGGQLETTYEFTNPYGHSFLYVTGRCEFAASASDGSYRTGTLTSAQAATLQRAFDLAHVEGTSFRAASGCPDATTFQVMTANGYLELVCDGDEPGYAQIAADAHVQAQQIADTGTAVDGDVSIVAIGYDGKEAASGVAWPFSWPITDAAVEWSTTNGAPGLLDAVRRLSGADAQLARQLRLAAIAAPSYRGHVDIAVGERAYELYVRDELDARLAALIVSFSSAVDPYAAKPIAVCSGKALDLALDTARVDERVLTVSTEQVVPCGAQLCWSGTFREEIPTATTLRLEAGSSPRRCRGELPYSTISAELTPIVDAFRSRYPSSTLVFELDILDYQGTVSFGEL